MTDEQTSQPSAGDADSRHDAVDGEIEALRSQVRALRRELRVARRKLARTEQKLHRSRRPGSSTRVIRLRTGAVARLKGVRNWQRREWSPRGWRWDLLAILAVVILAAAFRFPDLSSVPLGLQGDESASGLEARRIRDEGWIGVYSPVAAGNPTGFYYLVAASTSIFGETILGVRVVSAVIGVLTVVALYVLLRRNLGFVSAIAGSAFLAVSLWHVIFSRMAHVTVAWPLAMVLAAIALMEALRTWSWRWWAASGALLALGIYVYNGHTLVLAIVAAFVAYYLLGLSGVLAIGALVAAIYRPGLFTFGVLLAATALFGVSPAIRSRRRVTGAISFALALLAVSYPMLKFIAQREDDYFGRSRMLSLFNSEEWESKTSRAEQLRFLASRYVDSWDQLSFDHVPSVIDITGVAPLVTPSALILCMIGLALGLVRRFGPLVQLGAAIVLAMPLVPAAFTDVALRRALVMIPFLAMFAGIAVAEVVGTAWRRGLLVRIGAVAVVLLVSSLIGYRSVDGFLETMDSQTERWTLGPELVEASRYMDELPEGSYIYFYSDRWPLHYEVIRFLAPDASGETRGAPYGPDGIEINPTVDHPVFVLVGAYIAYLPDIQARYPGGTVVEGPPMVAPSTGPSFLAYVVSPG